MGLFSRKKKEPRQTTFTVSPNELIYLVDLAIKAIDPGQIEYEIEFGLNGTMHRIGIDYDRVNAPRKGYYPEYMSVYLDEQKFASLPELSSYATINGINYSEFGQEFVLDIVYKEPLETGNIEGNYSSVYYGPPN